MDNRYRFGCGWGIFSKIIFMKKVIIVGSGSHAAEVNDIIVYNNSIKKEFEIVGFIDDNVENYKKYQFSSSFLGGIEDHLVLKDYQYIIGIANVKYREKIVTHLLKQGADFLSLIHYSSFISPSAKLGKGMVIAPNVNIGPNVVIDDYCMLNSRSSIGHDSIIGKYNVLSPNVCFSGFTKVGDNNLFGINSATIPYIKIGNNNKIAAGMVVDKNVKNDAVVFYRFKEKIIAIPK